MANQKSGGSYWDRLLLSEDERARIDDARAAAQRGEIGWDEAHAYAEDARAAHGYSGGKHGDSYVKSDAAPAAPDEYGGAYREAVRRYTEMAPFTYDHNADARWQAYKKEYAREGRRASEDTMGQYAAMTGGVPSTAAVTAAQQAGDYYAAKLTDKLPALYDLAYAMYTGEGDRLYRQLSALQGARADELDRHEARLAQWNADRDRADALERQAWERARRETEYADARADRAADEAYRERGFEADRADRAADEAYRERGFEADRADRAEDVAYRERAYADARADRELAAANRASGRGGGGGKKEAEDAQPETPAELPVDYASVLDLGYGPISAERLSDLVAAGEVERYEQGGKLRFRRTQPTQAPAVPSFTERFRERFG